MNKKIISGILALAMSATLALSAVYALAQSDTDDYTRGLAQMIAGQNDSHYFDRMELYIGNNTLTVDNQKVQMDTAPKLENGRTMLPIRPVAEAAGAIVDYDVNTRSVVITNIYGDQINCPTGAESMTVNGVVHSLDVPSYIDNGRTFMPVRAIGEALNMSVEWDKELGGVVIQAPYQTCRILAFADSLDTSKLGAKQSIYDGSGMYVIQFDTPIEAKAAVEMLNEQGILAEPDRYIPPVEETSTGASAQGASYSWGVKTCGFDTFVTNYGGSISKSGVVAVVDTGVDASHPFLKGRVLPGYNFIAGNSNPYDDNFHGTHVSGTIIDCAGNTNVKILPVKVLDADGRGSTATIISGVKYAANQGADVINLSLGGAASDQLPDGADTAIQYAIEKGTIVVVSAGNDNRDTSRYCPAHLTTPGVVVVSAGDQNKNKASFSNYGDSVDLMAPGVAIKASIPNGGYKELNGTSMAAPHVSAAAVLLDLVTGKTLLPSDLETQVRSVTANSGVWKDKYVGCGFLDMSKYKGEKPTDPDPIIEYRYNVSSLDMKVGESKNVTVTAVRQSGHTENVTSACDLTSNAPGVASVDKKTGRVTALKEGSARIRMNFAGTQSTVKIPNPIDVTVKAKELVEIRLSTNKLNMKEGGISKITATGVYSDGSTKDMTSSVTLVSSNTSVVTVSSSGIVTAKKAGTARISVQIINGTIKLTNNPIDVTVTEVVKLVEIRLSTNKLDMKVGDTAKIIATGVYSNGSTKDITSSVGLKSADTSVAAVSNDGTVTAKKAGKTRISIGAITGVKLPSPIDVTVDESNIYTRLFWGIGDATSTSTTITMSVGDSRQIDLYGETRDGRVIKLTQECGIYVRDESIATIDASGKLVGKKAGSTYIGVISIPHTGLNIPEEIDITVTQKTGMLLP